MTTNDPYEAPRPYPASGGDEPGGAQPGGAQPGGAQPGDQPRYTPPPATQDPYVRWYPGTQAPSSSAAPQGTYGQGYGDQGYYHQSAHQSAHEGYQQQVHGDGAYYFGPSGTATYPYPYPYTHPQAGYGAYPYGATPAPVTTKRPRRLLAVLAAAVVAAALVIAGVGFSTGSSSTGGTGSLALPQLQVPNGGSGTGGTGGSGTGGSGGTTVPGGTTQPSTGSKTQASATQQVGVVTITSVLRYQNAESAGTGTILTSDGEILTNNHVVNGATSITVTVESTGKSYRADVVGTAPTKDVALLKLRNASGLQTAKFASGSSGASIGDAVTGVGNAGGTGTLTAAGGQITGLDKAITATDETGQEAEHLTGLIQINAPIIAGDSGGPLYDADGAIIGMDTAASTSGQNGQGGGQSTTAKTAYAIPIEDAMNIVDQIRTGVRTTTIHIGLPGFLGITTVKIAGGVGVQQVLAGGAAEQAGIAAGSTITSVNGTAITSQARLKAVLSAKNPGTKVTVAWTDASGQQHSASVTLDAGPAD